MELPEAGYEFLKGVKTISESIETISSQTQDIEKMVSEMTILSEEIRIQMAKCQNMIDEQVRCKEERMDAIRNIMGRRNEYPESSVY